MKPCRFFVLMLCLSPALGCEGDGGGGSSGPGGGGSDTAGSDAANGDGGAAEGDAPETGDVPGGDGSTDPEATAKPEPTTEPEPAPGPAVATPAGGEHFCESIQPEAYQWALGTGDVCTISKSLTPPMTAEQKQSADYACTFWGGTAKVVESCRPFEEAVGFCKLAPQAAGAESWKVFYEADVLPDAEALALNILATACTPVYDMSGVEIAIPKCKGTVKASIDGVEVDFSEGLFCAYKSDGVRAQYFVEGNHDHQSLQFDRLHLAVLKEGGAVTFGDPDGPGVGTGAGYLEDGNNAFVFPADAAAATVEASTFAEQGKHLVATFSLGEYKNGSGVVRTITGGTIDIEIVP